MLTWRLYYTNRTPFSSDDGEWSDAPYLGVAGLQCREVRSSSDPKHTGSIIRNGNFYVWWPDQSRPWACDWAGLLDYLFSIGGLAEDDRLVDISLSFLRNHGVKLGRTMNDVAWDAMSLQMKSDPDFPPKSARGPLEGCGT